MSDEELGVGEVLSTAPSEMERTSGISRTYYLGDYRNIKVFDNFVHVPKELAFDNEFMAAMKRSQLLSIEQTYREYLRLSKEIPNNSDLERAIEELENLQQTTTQFLLNTITGV